MGKRKNKSSAPAYHNFMESTLGLGRNGTHLVHGAAAGGLTWAAGKYGGVQVIQDNWYSPFIGALVGLGLSAIVRWIVMDDARSIDLALSEFKRATKDCEWTEDQWEILLDLQPEFESAANRRRDELEAKESEDEAKDLIQRGRRRGSDGKFKKAE